MFLSKKLVCFFRFTTNVLNVLCIYWLLVDACRLKNLRPVRMSASSRLCKHTNDGGRSPLGQKNRSLAKGMTHFFRVRGVPGNLCSSFIRVCVFCVPFFTFIWTSRGLDSDSCNCSTCVPRQKGQPRSLGLCRCFCQGQDLFLEGPLGASLCATSLCSLLCVHSSSSALARGNGQQLGVRSFTSFTLVTSWHHHDIMILFLMIHFYGNFALSKLKCLGFCFGACVCDCWNLMAPRLHWLRGQGFTDRSYLRYSKVVHMDRIMGLWVHRKNQNASWPSLVEAVWEMKVLWAVCLKNLSLQFLWRTYDGTVLHSLFFPLALVVSCSSFCRVCFCLAIRLQRVATCTVYRVHTSLHPTYEDTNTFKYIQVISWHDLQHSARWFVWTDFFKILDGYLKKRWAVCDVQLPSVAQVWRCR